MEGDSRAALQANVFSFSSKMSSFVTLRDIAAKADVSHTTVSLALRRDPRILPATAMRVRKIARALGYHRDAELSTLMAHLRRIRARPAQATLGFITAWPSRDGWRVSANHRRFHAGVLARARKLGYSLDEFWLLEPGMTPARMTRILRARGIRGLVVQSLPHSDGRLSLGWEYFACVTKGLTVTHPPLHRVMSFHYEDMRLVFHQLTRRGYRRIGLVLGEALSDRVDHAWLAAHYVYQNSIAGNDRVPPLLLEEGGGVDSFARWFQMHRPEVLLFSDQPVPSWVSRLGLQVPDGVGYVNLDWSPELAPMAGLDHKPEGLGVAAVDLLIGQLHAHEYGVPRHEKIITIKGRWVTGGTIRASRPR
jgi:LacI family transcriptional regulator